MTTTTDTQWKPIRKGTQYCSPGCGNGCTYAQYTHRMQLGADVSARLGVGWKYNVFENLGWHVEWYNGVLKLHYSQYGKSPGQYWAQVGEIGGPGGVSPYDDGATKMFDTPEEAIEDKLKDAVKAYVDQVKPTVDGLRKAVAGYLPDLLGAFD